MKTKAKKLIITTKRDIFNDIKANHPSIFNGDWMDFSELREYKLGDDSRFIDHTTSAKKQKLYVRVFKEEKELNIVTISLLGGSTFFGTNIKKQDFIASIVSTIGVLALSYQDNFSSAIFTDRFNSFIKPSKKLRYLQKSVEDNLEFEPLKKEIEFENIYKEIKKYIKKRSMIFLIGDFFDIFELKKLNTLHEVIVLIVRDRFEEELANIEYINLTDATSFEYQEVNIDKNFIKEYKENIKRHDHKLYNSLKKDRVRFVKIYTDENPLKGLRKLFWSKR